MEAVIELTGGKRKRRGKRQVDPEPPKDRPIPISEFLSDERPSPMTKIEQLENAHETKTRKQMRGGVRKGCLATLMIAKVLFTMGNVSVEELMHLRMNHPSLPKLILLNGKVTGLPRNLSKENHGKFQCHTCQDANAIRNDFPPASTNWTDRELWSWDLFDMGPDHPTLNGSRYCSMIIIKESRFGMVFLHADRSLETTTQVLKDAFRYAGCKPKNIRSDGAAEYVALDDFMRAEGIHHQFSNPDEQEQNGLAEKFGDQIG
jgi:hypothetical protein